MEDLKFVDPSSPCTGTCRLDRRTRWCVGCGRTGSEIGRWPTSSNEEKNNIHRKLPVRLAMLNNKRVR